MLTPVRLQLAGAEGGRLRVQSWGRVADMTECLGSKAELLIAPDAAAGVTQPLSLLLGSVRVFLSVSCGT